YANDDEWLMSGVHGRNIVRDARMIRETTYADQVVYSEGGAMTGPAGQPNTWVRLHHSVDPVTGEHELRGGSSLDGKNWIWGTTYTMPADVDFRIGLFAVGASADDAAFTARYDYLRVLRP
ncbi:MAG: family 43 glycosylhydrolase, partial [Micromonosporaceae bacterium]